MLFGTYPNTSQGIAKLEHDEELCECDGDVSNQQSFLNDNGEWELHVRVELD